MKTEYRMFKKFAYGDDVYISMSMPVVVEDTEYGRTITGNYIHLLAFGQCADHLREEICETLGADTEYLASNDKGES